MNDLASLFKKYRKYRVAIELLNMCLSEFQDDLFAMANIIDIYQLTGNFPNEELLIEKGQEIIKNDPYNKGLNYFSALINSMSEARAVRKTVDFYSIGNYRIREGKKYLEQDGIWYAVGSSSTINNRVSENQKVYFAKYEVNAEVIVDFIEPYFTNIGNLRSLL